jgi:hypothetical protein
MNDFDSLVSVRPQAAVLTHLAQPTTFEQVCVCKQVGALTIHFLLEKKMSIPTVLMNLLVHTLALLVDTNTIGNIQHHHFKMALLHPPQSLCQVDNGFPREPCTIPNNNPIFQTFHIQQSV